MAVKYLSHKGARPPYENDIYKYLEKEIKEGAVIGPFKSPPFKGPCRISPLNSVAKKESASRRVIVDLSFPENKSVNSGIKADFFLGKHDKLKFPNIDDLVRIIHKKSPGALLFKRDLSRAYRQLPADVGTVHLLGYWFRENYYFDLSLPMGLVSSSRFCQMLSDSIVYIFRTQGYDAVNYIDDFGGGESPDEAWNVFYTLGKIISDIGMTEAQEKASPPSHIMIFLGLEVNTLLMTLRIPADKLQDIRNLLKEWENKHTASKRDTQQLCGLLNFVASCIKPGRIYFSRILNFLRTFKRDSKRILNTVRSDIAWWKKCANKFNGISLIMNPTWEKPGDTVFSDACLTGAGACTENEYFHTKFPASFVNICNDINQRECVTILVALKLWGSQWSRKNIVIMCDNSNSVQAVNSGASRDPLMQKILRNIHWICAEFSILVRAVQVRTYDNEIADCLSRWENSARFRHRFAQLTAGRTLKLINVPDQLFELLEL